MQSPIRKKGHRTGMSAREGKVGKDQTSCRPIDQEKEDVFLAKSRKGVFQHYKGGGRRGLSEY